MYLKLPTRYSKCKHVELTRKNQRLGSGTFGTVKKFDDTTAAKQFVDSQDFFNEIMITEMVKVGLRLRQTDNITILTNNSACVPCRIIFFPLMRYSLAAFSEFSAKNVPQLVDHFRHLQDAVIFLNKTCGLFHSDIDPLNILVEQTPDPTDIGRLFIADLGVASPHDGNDMINIRLLDENNTDRHKLIYQRSAEECCKEAYKSFMVSSFLYQRALMQHGVDDPYGFGAIRQDIALKIDMSALALCLLWCIVRIADVTNKTKIFARYEKRPIARASLLLSRLAPKVVMFEILSDLWETEIDIGLSSNGMSRGVILTEDDIHDFREWTTITKKQFAESEFFNNKHLIQNADLKYIFLELIKYDFFRPRGK